MKEKICILGSGIAALQLAVHLDSRYDVTIITKSQTKTSNSYKAQGGIAAVLSPEDRFEFHVKDTIRAGCRHHNEKEVEKLVKEGAAVAEELVKSGLPADRRPDGGLDLGLEGAHTVHRILHCGGDATGKFVIQHLLGQLGKSVRMIEHELAFELMVSAETGRVTGVKNKNGRRQHPPLFFRSYRDRNRRAWELVSFHLQPPGNHRRRDCNGIPGRRGTCRYGVRPVPPDIIVCGRLRERPCVRSRPRRGCSACG